MRDINKFDVWFFVLIILYSIGTVKRGAIWKDELSLWSDTVNKSSNSARAHYNLGVNLYNNGQPEQAIKEFKKAVEIAPNYADAHYNLGAVYQNRGLLDKAVSEYRYALNVLPDSADAYYNLGVIYTQLGFFEEAISAFKEALRINPDYKAAQQDMERAIYLNQDHL